MAMDQLGPPRVVPLKETGLPPGGRWSRGDVTMTQPGTGKYERLLERCRGLAPIPTAVAWPCEETALAGAIDAAREGLISQSWLDRRRRPKVAILAAVETVNSRMPATLDAAALCKMAEQGQIKGGLDGPLGFDNAISRDAAKIQGIISEVAGDPDVLLAPDLEAGNMIAKQLSFLADADSAGLVLGAKVPVILTSRANSLRSRIASCGVAVMAAHSRRKPPR
jgi:hypothetical protein